MNLWKNLTKSEFINRVVLKNSAIIKVMTLATGKPGIFARGSGLSGKFYGENKQN